MFFSDNKSIDLSPLLIKTKKYILNDQSINPNSTYDKELESQLKTQVTHVLKTGKSLEDRVDKIAAMGQESHTVLKYIEKSYQGKLRIKDYRRNNENSIKWLEHITYNGTAFPDLLCIFKEDAEKVESIGKKTLSEYCKYIWDNHKKFKHFFFEVEAEFNLTSFKHHDKIIGDVLESIRTQIIII